MSINFTQLMSLMAAPYQRVNNFKIVTGLPGLTLSSWTAQNLPGVAPTTAAVPTRTTTGALGQVDSSGTQRLVGAELNWSSGLIWLVDRLSHQGGLDATVTSAQTTNLPTAALTRYTSGVGVYAALEIYTQIGATSTTVSISYTNTAGTAGQVSPLISFGNGNYREAQRFMIVPLVAGDLGVKSVESVTVTATTGTAGNFGVTLFKPLYPMIVPSASSTYPPGTPWNPILSVGWNLPAIANDACLMTLIGPASGQGYQTGATLYFGED